MLQTAATLPEARPIDGSTIAAFTAHNRTHWAIARLKYFDSVRTTHARARARPWVCSFVCVLRREGGSGGPLP